MRSVGASHVGKIRTENQDKIFFHDQPVGNLKNLYIVAEPGDHCQKQRE